MLSPSMSSFMSLKREQALRLAAVAHAGQVRRGSGVPYVEHAFAVAWILDRAGFDEDTVVAGLLHDVVEDTPVTLEEIASRFGPGVAEMVGLCTERKTDEAGRKRPWIDRKSEHLDSLASAPLEARAIILADKLHNLISIEIDLQEGRPVWSDFHADRAHVLWYYDAMIACCGQGDPRLQRLAGRCREILGDLKNLVR